MVDTVKLNPVASPKKLTSKHVLNILTHIIEPDLGFEPRPTLVP